jgi:NADH dehydrogenase
MARMMPGLPLIGGGKTRFQPAFVGDVARAIADAVEGAARKGTVYELGGPEVVTFRRCMEIMLREIDRRRLLIPVPWGVATILGAVLQHLPGKLLTVDQVRQLRFDNVVSPAAESEGRSFKGLGISPTTLEAILPAYLSRFRR